MILPSYWVDLIRRLKASIASMKSNGERGQPYLKPLPMQKKVEASQLTRMEILALVMQLIIHFIVCGLNPVCVRINLMKSHSMQTKAFLRSNLRMRALDFFDFIL
jgi:hypothetical protein